MNMSNSIVISLVVFDGDDTLWSGLDGGYISGTSYPDYDRDDFSFRPLKPLLIQRDDGQRFRLFPEVPGLLPELVQRGVLVSLASYNHHQTLDADSGSIWYLKLLQTSGGGMEREKR